MIDQFLIEFIHDHLPPNHDNFDGTHNIFCCALYIHTFLREDSLLFSISFDHPFIKLWN